MRWLNTKWHFFSDFMYRFCRHCGVLDNELHFLLNCSKSPDSVLARQTFMTELATLHPDITPMNENDKFKFIMSSTDQDTCLLLEKLMVRLVKKPGVIITLPLQNELCQYTNISFNNLFLHNVNDWRQCHKDNHQSQTLGRQ